MLNNKKICVLFGGQSTEHLISCRSAATVIRALREAGHEPFPVGITEAGEWLRFTGPLEAMTDGSWENQAREALRSRPLPTSEDLCSPRSFIIYHCGVEPDLVYPAVHGINCEDGVLQGFLELAGFPYVGSGVLASAAGMDKDFAKTIFRQAGIPVVEDLVLRRAEIQADVECAAHSVIKTLGLPVFIKPANGGSSVGTYQARTEAELVKNLTAACVYDEKLLLERFVAAREIEVAVLGNGEAKAALPGEIVKEEAVDYYDYETKYFKGGANVQLPALIPDALGGRLRTLALQAYHALGCTGLARVDFFYEAATGKIYLNEINTLPGFTSISLYPMAFEQQGYSLPQLVDRLCELALELHVEKKRRLKA